MLITKRDGRKVLFDVEKIKLAIKKAFDENKKEIDDNMLTMLALRAFASAQNKGKELTVENIQDAVESTLMECGFDDIAKSYILYRKQRENVRNIKLDVNKVVEGYLGEEDWRVKENSTVSYSLGGFILSNSGAVTANYWLNHYYDKEIADAHKNCYMHIHDLSMLSGYCFTGDTRISLTDGTYPTFEELVNSGKTEVMIYAYDLANKKFVEAKAINIRKTRDTNEFVYIRLNSGDEIRCTPDHKFLLADGTYKEAEKLSVSDRLMCINNEDDIYPDVVEFTETDGLTPVYDLEVPEYNNFALDNGVIVHNCAGWSLKQLIVEGLGGVPNRISSKPAKHLHTLCNQMVNFLGIMQNEWAGAQAFSSFDTYLSAFVKKDNLSYDEVKQCIQSFVFGVNTPSRWGCVDTDTEVLSVDGFKKYDELKEGDIIYTWKDGKLNTNKVNKVIVKPFKGIMHTYVGDNYIQRVTDNHRVLMRYANEDNFHITVSDQISNDKIGSVFLPLKFDNTASNYVAGEFTLCHNQEEIDNAQKMYLIEGYTSVCVENEDGTTAVFVQTDRDVCVDDRLDEVYTGLVWCPNVEDGTAVFRKNGCVYISGQTQAPFTNITLDWTCPEDLKNMPAIVGGEPQDFTYGDCQKEMDIVNKAFIDVMMDGDANGRGFQWTLIANAA